MLALHRVYTPHPMMLDAGGTLFGAQMSKLLILWHFISKCSINSWVTRRLCWAWVKGKNVQCHLLSPETRELIPHYKVNLETLRDISRPHLSLTTPSSKLLASFRLHHFKILFWIHFSHLVIREGSKSESWNIKKCWVLDLKLE